MTRYLHLAPAAKSARVVVGESKVSVAVWDFDPPARVSSFDTILDFGGDRLAVSDDGQVVLAAAYRRFGLAAYEATDGKPLWQRRDIKRPQRLSVSHARAAVYVGTDASACQVVSLSTGVTIDRLRGVRNVVESPAEPIAFVDRNQPAVVAMSDFRVITPVPRTTFGFLAAAFGEGMFAVAEAGGPVRCFLLEESRLAWSFSPPAGVHCLDLAFHPVLQQFVGVLWPYEHGGDKQLVVFDSHGDPSRGMSIGCPAETCFCMGGSTLLTSTGLFVDPARQDQRYLWGTRRMEG